MRACTRVGLLYTISYRVQITQLHDRRIPNVGVGVRVGVSPVEFELYHTVTFAIPAVTCPTLGMASKPWLVVVMGSESDE